MMDKTNWVKFFKEIFLVANVSPEVVLEMPFLTLSNADIDFSVWELQWKIYTTKKALPTTKHVKLVGKKEFAAVALDPKHETYVVYVASLNSTPLIAFDVYPFKKPQISGLIAKKAYTIQKSPPSIWTLQTFSLQTWRPSSPSTSESMTTVSN